MDLSLEAASSEVQPMAPQICPGRKEVPTPSPCEALSFASGKEACLCKLPLIDLVGQTHVTRPLFGRCMGQWSPLWPVLRAEESRGQVAGPLCTIS